MRHLLALTLALAPLAAQASYGPELTFAQTQDQHVTQTAWTDVSDPSKPGCTDPTPVPVAVVYACAVSTISK